MDLGDTIKAENNASQKDKAKAMIFLRRHLDEGLKNEYLTLKDPADLWKDLEERYNHQKTVILPQAQYVRENFLDLTCLECALVVVVSRKRI